MNVNYLNVSACIQHNMNIRIIAYARRHVFIRSTIIWYICPFYVEHSPPYYMIWYVSASVSDAFNNIQRQSCVFCAHTIWKSKCNGPFFISFWNSMWKLGLNENKRAERAPRWWEQQWQKILHKWSTLVKLSQFVSSIMVDVFYTLFDLAKLQSSLIGSGISWIFYRFNGKIRMHLYYIYPTVDVKSHRSRIRGKLCCAICMSKVTLTLGLLFAIKVGYYSWLF